MSIADALNKINVLQEKLEAKDTELKAVKFERDEANSVLDGQVRASLIKKARDLNLAPESQLARMNTGQLEHDIGVVERQKHTNPKSIMFSTDAPGKEDNLDLYSERMKRRQQ
jgi:hypothetical protein